MIAHARTLFLIRHGPTEWNAGHRIQGHTDIPLSAAGRGVVANRTLSDAHRQARWFCSPLSRARETATLMGLNADIESALIEMCFGEWEGCSKFDNAVGPALSSRGWAGQPPGGESREEALQRILAWLAVTPPQGDLGAVVHGGLIKTLYAHATNWDLRGAPKHELNWEAVHAFKLDRYGRVIGGTYACEQIGDERAWQFPKAA